MNDTRSETEFPLAVCICTRNRPVELARALESIANSRCPVPEIIVSDDSTDDRTAAMMPEFPGVRYVVGPRRGLCSNRNNALRYVSQPYTLFVDDDDLLAPDFVSEIARFIAMRPAVERERLIVSGTEMTNGRLVVPSDLSFLGYQQKPYSSDHDLRTVVITSTVIPTRLFEEVGFDENIVYGFDEVDVTVRAVKCGYRIALCRSASNVHLSSPLNREYYIPFTDASRLYVTFKRYAFVEGDWSRALAYAVVAPAHLLAHRIGKEGAAGIASWFATVTKSVRFTIRYLTQPAYCDGPPRRASGMQSATLRSDEADQSPVAR